MNPTGFLKYVVISMMLLPSCKTDKPRPDELVGEYLVVIDVENNEKENLYKPDTGDFFDSFSISMEESWDQWSDTLDIQYDTSTIEGKLEYAARMFGRSMKEMGGRIGGLMEDLGDHINDISQNAGEWKQKVLSNIRFRVELQQDGDIKIKEDVSGLFLFREAKWKVEKDSFYVLQNDSVQYSLHIIERSQSRLVLKKEDVTFYMDKEDSKDMK